MFEREDVFVLRQIMEYRNSKVLKEIHAFAHCQKVQCERPKNDGEEDRGQIMKPLML